MIYVTCLIDLQEDRTKDKSMDRYFDLFGILAGSGVSIVLYLEPRYVSRISYPNVTVIPTTLQNLWTDQQTPLIANLPAVRTVHHDTRNFLVLMNAKMELMARTMETHPDEVLAWIDFGIFHVLKDHPAAIQKLQDYPKLPLQGVTIPGCWPHKAHYSTDHVCWRFCGGFFIGDRASLKKGWELYLQHYPKWVKDKLTWEVNIWSGLEMLGWEVKWVLGDHNDSILPDF